MLKSLATLALTAGASSHGWTYDPVISITGSSWMLAHVANEEEVRMDVVALLPYFDSVAVVACRSEGMTLAFVPAWPVPKGRGNMSISLDDGGVDLFPTRVVGRSVVLEVEDQGIVLRFLERMGAGTTMRIDDGFGTAVYDITGAVDAISVVKKNCPNVDLR